MWDELRERIADWWESDDVFRMQIVLAVIVGAIGFAWALAEVAARTRGNPEDFLK